MTLTTPEIKEKSKTYKDNFIMLFRQKYVKIPDVKTLITIPVFESQNPFVFTYLT